MTIHQVSGLLAPAEPLEHAAQEYRLTLRATARKGWASRTRFYQVLSLDKTSAKLTNIEMQMI